MMNEIIKTPSELAETLGITSDAVRQALAEFDPTRRFSIDRTFSLAEAAAMRSRFSARLNGTAELVQGEATEAETKIAELEKTITEIRDRAHRSETRLAEMSELETKLNGAARQKTKLETELKDAWASSVENANRAHELETQLAEITAKTDPAGFLKSDGFLQTALLICLFSQMVHTGGFFWHESPIEQPFLKAVLSVSFAIAVDCVAILLTVHRGGRGYLWAFAVFHFVMNMVFHYSIHGIGFGNALLSLVLAASTLFCSELFTEPSKAVEN